MELYMHEKAVFFLPVNILMVWHTGYLANLEVTLLRVQLQTHQFTKIVHMTILYSINSISKYSVVDLFFLSAVNEKRSSKVAIGWLWSTQN